jgi:hypothetical protein
MVGSCLTTCFGGARVWHHWAFFLQSRSINHRRSLFIIPSLLRQIINKWVDKIMPCFYTPWLNYSWVFWSHICECPCDSVYSQPKMIHCRLASTNGTHKANAASSWSLCATANSATSIWYNSFRSASHSQVVVPSRHLMHSIQPLVVLQWRFPL